MTRIAETRRRVPRSRDGGRFFRNRYLPRLRPLPGAPELLRRMPTRVWAVVANSAKEEEIEV